jgi:quercetin dioxygenase-like cupin family protein
MSIHIKGWGHEEWKCNTELYCAKYLHVEAGKRCSLHYHKIKDETFIILDGLIEMEYLFDIADLAMNTLRPGDKIRIYPGVAHRFKAINDSIILEVSTHHDETDSIRIENGD